MRNLRKSFVTNNGTLMVTPYIPWVVRGTALVMALFVIPLDIITRDALSEYEADLINDLQKHRSYQLDYFFKVIIFMGSHNIVIFALPMLYNIIESTIIMKVTIVCTHTLYLYTLFAVIFTEPRPYWVRSEIKGINCENGFGSPAEEVLFSMVFLLYCIIELIEGKIRHSYLVLLYVVASLWILLLCFSELLLGENFIHQIFLTLCVGYVCFTMILLMDIYISQLASISSFYNDKNRKAKIYWFVASMAMVFIVLCLHMNIDKNTNIPIKWIKNAYKDCNFDKDISGYYSFYQSSWVFYNLGAVNGAQFTSKHLPFDWWQTGWVKKIIRMALDGGIGYGIYYGFNSIPTYDAHTKFIFHYCINVFVCGLVCYGGLPYVFSKLRLTKTEDNQIAGSFASGVSMRMIND